MDKRLIKTRRAIYDAFTEVLNKKSFKKITIEDILEESKISRSTFYAHYKTKEELLDSILNTITDHVFSHSLEEESTHDFSKTNILDYNHLFTHILYHLHDEKTLITAILNNDCRDNFLNILRKKIKPLATRIVNDNIVNHKEVPLEIEVDTVIESFIIIINYWFKNDCKETPEKITTYFIKINK